MLNVAEGRSSDDPIDLAVLGNRHNPMGGPTFSEFPDFRHGAHQQQHITQIHRAYLGGMRLMSALAIHNRGLEYGMGWVVCGNDGRPTVDTTSDADVVRAHVQAMRQIAELNKDWLEIAYTPEQARRIIESNRLAIILGVEVPEIDSFLPAGRSIADRVDELVNLGIRQVVIVHGMDNALGGSALFNDLYNTVGDWMNRPPASRDEVQALSGSLTVKPFSKAAFFDITSVPPEPLLPEHPDDDPILKADPILFRLSNPHRVVLSNVFTRPDPRTHVAPLLDVPYGPLHPFVNTAPAVATERGVYDGYVDGHRNARRLSGRGEEMIRTLAKRGMLLDFAHMGDETVKGALTALDSKGCGEYPFMVSHAHFRHLPFTGDYSDRLSAFVDRTKVQARRIASMSECIHDRAKCDATIRQEAELASLQSPFFGPGSVNRANLPREYDLSTRELLQLENRQGAIGVFASHNPVDDRQLPQKDSKYALDSKFALTNDCAGSSKGFAVALRFAESMMKTNAAIGLASDFTMVKNTVPRFGEHACAAYEDAGVGSSSGAQLLDVLLNAGQYKLGEQADPVRYLVSEADAGKRHLCGEKSGTFSDGYRNIACGMSEPLEPYIMGNRVYDYNVDGFAHLGMEPDFLQDVANVLQEDAGGALDRIFGSAEGLISMWERARAMVGCGVSETCASEAATPMPPANEWCGDGCPLSWNGGAPLQSVLSLYGDCENGLEIRFPVYDEEGKLVRDQAPKYYHHRPGPANDRREDDEEPNRLREQGDWAVYPLTTRQLWTCGKSPSRRGNLRVLGCPPEASYVKVRRVLDASIGDTQDCRWVSLPPTKGNRAVIFDCLAGPPDRRSIPESVEAARPK